MSSEPVGDASHEDDSSIARTEPRLAAVQAELVTREPIFYRPEHGTGRKPLRSRQSA